MNKFELEPKPSEANEEGVFSDKTAYLTWELWKKNLSKSRSLILLIVAHLRRCYVTYSSLCELKKKKITSEK